MKKPSQSTDQSKLNVPPTKQAEILSTLMEISAGVGTDSEDILHDLMNIIVGQLMNFMSTIGKVT
jgi:chemotaxis protein CheY-P-specific phosphatase CheC